MLLRAPDEVTTPLSYSERLQNTLDNFVPLLMRAAAVVYTGHWREANIEDKKDDDIGLQLSFNSSNNVKKKPVTTKNGTSDQFETVRTISTASYGMQESSENPATSASGIHDRLPLF